jgi:hypothetical protein
VPPAEAASTRLTCDDYLLFPGDGLHEDERFARAGGGSREEGHALGTPLLPGISIAARRDGSLQAPGDAPRDLPPAS